MNFNVNNIFGKQTLIIYNFIVWFLSCAVYELFLARSISLGINRGLIYHISKVCDSSEHQSGFSGRVRVGSFFSPDLLDPENLDSNTYL